MTSKRTDFVHHLVIGLSCSWVLLAGSESRSAEIDAQFSAGIGQSDNIARTEDNEVEATIGVAGFEFGLTEETRRLSADIRSQFDYLYYDDSAIPNEWIGGLAATLNLTLLDERLIWLLQDNFGQQTSNEFIPAGTGNREDVNFFTTGPTLSLFPGSRNLVRVDLRYSSVNFEDRNTDNTRQSATLSVGREVRRGTQLSLNATAEQVEYDNDGLSPDFDRYEGFVRYELAGNRNTIGMDVGYTEVGVRGNSADGVLARINWVREVTSNSTFVLNGGTSYSDQGNIFRFNQGISTDLRDTGDTVRSAAPFTSNFVTMSYGMQGSRTSTNIIFRWRQEDYDGGPPIDRDISEAILDLSRDVSQSVFTSLRLQYQRRDFKYLGVIDDNTIISAEIGYRLGPSYNVSLQYQYFDRSGDDSLTEVRENRLFFRFFYTPAWGR